MKKPALMLVAAVIGFQLVIIAGTLVGCFVVSKGQGPGNNRCSGENISELMSQITAAAFALYAGEKGSS